MSMHTGRVVGGKVIVDGDPLPEGAELAIRVLDDETPFHLTPEMEAELEEAAARLDRGEYVTWEEARARLRRLQREIARR
ncbi:MAG: hypothetical protein U0893_09445 [Chloroflexota bacterium]